jgi:putative intracellular protease/amidase
MGKKMKKSIISFATIFIIGLFGVSVEPKSASKVLLILREGTSPFDAAKAETALTEEVGVMISMLNKAGFQVVVASASGQPVVGTSTTLVPDFKTADVKSADYVGVVMPCMALGEQEREGRQRLPVDSESVRIIKQALAEGKPVAAQDASIYLLAEAGILVGKRYALITDAYKFFGDSRFEGAIYSKEHVVKDGNIITSRLCPDNKGYLGETEDGTAKLTQALIAELKKK